MKKNKTAIVIITYNNLDYTINCIESIKKYTKKNTYEIIIIDNMSTDGTREWLKNQSDLKVIMNDYNLGFPKGCNQGIEVANADFDILLLNNDTIVTTNWLDNLKKCLYSSNEIGAVGAVSNHDENLQGVDFAYDNFDTMQELAKNNNISNKDKWEEKAFLIGFCILIKREVINKVKCLDEFFSPGYIDDNDLSLRIIKAGYKLMLCHDSFIHHYLGSAFRKDLNKFYPILYKNREYFKLKWGFETFAFDEIKHASLRMLEEDKDKNFKILELESGIGITILKIKESYKKAEIHGIEENIKMADIAKNFADVDISSIGVFPQSLNENYYDYIIIGSILERISNPNEFLQNIKKYLKDGGYVIGETHNLSNYNIILELLNDNWYFSKYNFPKTNTNNFTKNDIANLFYVNNFKNPAFLHWFSLPNEEEIKKIDELGKIVGDDKISLYKTHYYSFKFQK